MPTHAQIAGRLLRDAAQFFRTVGDQNEPLKPQMDENANVFEQVATLVEQDPMGIVDDPEEQTDDNSGDDTPPAA